MPLRRALLSALVATVAAGLAACDVAGPLGGPQPDYVSPPLPGLAELRRAYGDEAPGVGYVKESGRVDRTGGLDAAATFWTVEGDSARPTRTYVVLQTGARGPVQLAFEGRPESIPPGAQTTVYAGFDGLGGQGPLGITAVSDDRLAGVFAANVNNLGSYLVFEIHKQVYGGFNAVRVAAPE